MFTGLNPLNHPICFSTPRRLTPFSAWHEHIPFAMFLVDLLKPDVIVELGTYYGDSYCAFCQAVEELYLGTCCYAVDTWQGDPHSGLYGPEVVADLRAHHDQLYGSFSRLIQSTFNEALIHFEDGTIDLLHIDGYHTYEVVRGEFEAWLPKMSPCGVVLFHDINVREGDFGVWKLWNELKVQYAYFEFVHGHGLGVLAVGESYPAALERLFDMSDTDVLKMRKLFFELGHRLTLIQTDKQFAQLEMSLRETEAALKEAEAALQEREAALKETQEVLRETEAILKERDRVIEDIGRTIGWRVLERFRRVRDRVLPLGTRRRNAYWILRDGVEVLMGGGPKVLVPKAAEKIHRRVRPEGFLVKPGAQEMPEEGNVQYQISVQGDRLSPRKMKEEIHKFLSDPDRRLQFPQYEDPLISIFIVTYNRAEYTLQCFINLLSHGDVAYEVVIVDNGSTDESLFLLEKVRNATVIKNSENLGFIHACNQGAQEAQGKYVLFLNNDAYVTRGALSALVDTIERVPNTGAVGAKLILPTGRLQEAGSVTWRDGSALGYGRDDDGDKGEYCYVREVDFCSGACLLVRKKLFDRLGGFDTRYAPAYYEDADLCMGVRELGYKILFQPKAVVIHHEFSSSSSDRARFLCRQNQPRLEAKWRTTLASHLPASPENLLKARDKRSGRTVIVLDDRIPMPDRGSGYPRMFAMLRFLRELGYRVSFIPVADSTKREPHTERLQQLGIEVLYGPINLAEELERRKTLDPTVIVSRPHTAAVTIPLVRELLPDALVIYDAEALVYRREELRAKLEGQRIDSEEIVRLRESELRLIHLADKVITVSERERELVSGETGLGHDVFVWGHPQETCTPSSPFGERRDILFVGGFLSSPSPNEDAVLHFSKRIFPCICRELPDVRLIVVGADPPKAVVSVASPSVVIRGHVANVEDYYGRCRLFVNPVRYAAGVPLKLIEAMGFGLPSVVSEVAASGLRLEDGEQALICKDDREFIEKTVRLYQDESVWLKVQRGALRYIEEHYRPDKMKECLAHIMESSRSENKRAITTGERSIDISFGRSAVENVSGIRFGTRWYRLPGRAWHYYRESGARVVVSKTRGYLLARWLRRWNNIT